MIESKQNSNFNSINKAQCQTSMTNSQISGLQRALTTPRLAVPTMAHIACPIDLDQLNCTAVAALGGLTRKLVSPKSQVCAANGLHCRQQPLHSSLRDSDLATWNKTSSFLHENLFNPGAGQGFYCCDKMSFSKASWGRKCLFPLTTLWLSRKEVRAGMKSREFYCFWCMLGTTEVPTL